MDDTIQIGIQKFSPLIAEIEKIKATGTMKVTSPEDKEGYKKVKDARIQAKNTRCEIERIRQNVKSIFLDGGRAVDAEAKRLTEMIEPTEKYLEEQEAIVEAEIERIKKEKEDAEQNRRKERAQRLADNGVMFNGTEFHLEEIKEGIKEVYEMEDQTFDILVNRFAEENKRVISRRKALADAEEEKRQAQILKDKELKEKEAELQKREKVLQDAEKEKKQKEEEEAEKLKSIELQKRELERTQRLAPDKENLQEFLKGLSVMIEDSFKNYLPVIKTEEGEKVKMQIRQVFTIAEETSQDLINKSL